MEKVAAIVLAAGASRRHPVGDKLLRLYEGEPLLSHCLQNAAGCDFASLICVVRPGSSEVEALAESHGFKVVVNEQAEFGVGSSIAAGVSALSDEIAAAAIFLGDMPSIQVATIRALLERFRAKGRSQILRPTFNEEPGHPVFFSADWFEKLKTLSGDEGARNIIQSASSVKRCSVEDHGVIHDLDIASAFEAQ